jgi:hypothetical protein
VGYFVRDFGYFLILLAVAVVYWFAAVRPSQRARRAEDDPTSG